LLGAPLLVIISLLVHPGGGAPPSTEGHIPVAVVEGVAEGASHERASGPDLVWAFETRGRITGKAASGPQGVLYFGSHDGHLYAIDDDGHLRWKRALGGIPFGSPVVDAAGVVYVASDPDRLRALRPTGEVVWDRTLGGPVDHGLALAPGNELRVAAGGDLLALERSGKLRWKRPLGARSFGPVAVDQQGTTYLGSQDDHVYAVDMTGTLRWRVRMGGDVDSGVLLTEQEGSSSPPMLFAASDTGRVAALSTGGQVLWARDLGAALRSPLALSGDGQSVLALSQGPGSALHNLDAQTGKEQWVVRFPFEDSYADAVAPGPLVDPEGRVFIGTLDGVLRGFSSTGKRLWVHPTLGRPEGLPALSDGGLLLWGTSAHRLLAFTSF
ncbi:MAG: PQQ-binding-like beta-propeller repeat protein, partial [Myxococcales bacterium]|nr:PQQ-binding-like beta-propeller repeat protein [Myxococcales bacterium]